MSQNMKQKRTCEKEVLRDVIPLFPTDADSLLFVERTINLVISTILHVRELLPKSEFQDEVFDGTPLKMLKKNSENVNTQQIELWLSGVMDAFKRKFIKNVCLEISDSRNYLILESYTINFHYGTGNNKSTNVAVLPGTRNNSNSRSLSGEKNDAQSEASRLLQTCLALAKSCSQLPKIVSVALKMLYQDNTPRDYQPYGQKYNLKKMSPFVIKPKKIALGAVNTGHHTLDFNTKTCFSNESFLTEIEEKATKHKANDKTGAMSHVLSHVKKQKTQSRPEGDNRLSPLAAGSHEKLGASLVASSQFTDNASESDSVRCPCLSQIKSSLMYQCSGCSNWVHAECFGIDVLSTKIHIDIFYCQLCHKLNRNLCQDKKMVELDVAHKQQKLAVKRRLLGYCNRTKDLEVSFEKFERVSGLECQKELIQALLKEMAKLQIINQTSHDTYLIDKKVAAEKMAEYFYVVSPPVSAIPQGARKKTIAEQTTPPMRDGKLKKKKTRQQLRPKKTR